MAVQDNALSPGTIIISGAKNYRIVRVLGAGGFGITYLVECVTDAARPPEGGSTYFAMKELFMSKRCNRERGTTMVLYSAPVAQEFTNCMRDFITEATRLQSLGRLHNNIVRVDDIFQSNNTAYYTMEYLQGQTLRSYVQGCGRLTPQEASQLLLPIADAVQYLHDNQLTHLDIKPDNIMLTVGADGNPRPVLIDFGLSKHYDDYGHPTSRINTSGCSDGYSPVEQYGGITTFQPTADIYALGATFMFCITGMDPAKATDMMPETVGMTLYSFGPQVSGMVGSMMAMNRVERPHDLKGIIATMRQLATGYVMPPDNGAGVVPPPFNPGGSYGYGGQQYGGSAGNGVMYDPNWQNQGGGYVGGKRHVNKKARNIIIISAVVVMLAICAIVGWMLFGGPREHQYNRYNSLIDMYTDAGVDEQSSTTVSDGAYLQSAMSVTLEWNSYTDFDLIAIDPSGNDVSFINLEVNAGGARHSGDEFGGAGSMESIQWSRPVAGHYDFFICARNLRHDEETVDFTVYVDGIMKEYTAELKHVSAEYPEYFLIHSLDLDEDL